uniref:cytochrome-c oxidase n=1 Tax=Lacrimia lanifica TaxID=2016125 RepID=A0A6G5ZUV2_9EUGL|nr:cytochrome c oxidase subunit 2 [Lacrimia lanifica]
MLLQGLAVLYCTHSLLECMNIGVVLLVSILALHAMVVCSRALYGSNLYVELVWLLAPTVVVVLLLARTVCMQCSDEELTAYGVECMVVGNQWYWVYTTHDASLYLYAVREHELYCGDLRLLHTTQCIVVDSATAVLMVCSSVDVIHSWTVPTLGVKVDCVPGRANTTGLMHALPGVLYGQCSEICGSLHGYMPLSISWF